MKGECRSVLKYVSHMNLFGKTPKMFMLEHVTKVRPSLPIPLVNPSQTFVYSLHRAKKQLPIRCMNE